MTFDVSDIWFDLTAPSGTYMRRIYESVSVPLSIGLFFNWVIWTVECQVRFEDGYTLGLHC